MGLVSRMLAEMHMATASDTFFTSEDDNLNAYVWAIMDDHTEDEFIGKNDGSSYFKIVFTDEDKQALLEAEDVADKEFVKSIVGAALYFEADQDTDEDAPAISYYKSITDLEADWQKAIDEAGGYVESDEDGEDGEDGDADDDGEDASDDGEAEELTDEDIDDAILEMIDENALPEPDRTRGSDVDAGGSFAMYSIEKLLPGLADYGEAYQESVAGYVGIVLRCEKEDDSDEITRWIVWATTPEELKAAFDGNEIA